MSVSKTALKSTLLLPVFIPAIAVILLIIIGTLSNPELAGTFFASILASITQNFGWFYMLAVAIFLVFIVTIALSPWGKIKLGPDHVEAEYTFLAWFAMLFSAGYGIALLFFGVAEPVLHFASPPTGPAETVGAAKEAMQIAFFHWGFHIWAIYGLVGLTLAYFSFRHNLPLSMRSTLYPLIGDRIYGPIGHSVDTFAILGTVFGLATTLGLSVTQINAGIHYLIPSIPIATSVQIIAIVIITGLAIFSVVAGMDKGIKRLSLLNIGLAIALMLFVFVAGPSIFILETFLQNTGSYLSNIVERTFNLQAYSSSDWIGHWTIFIFGWTIAWAPFVGLFIAKISKGRTIRQFVLGVMLVPTIFTFFWFSVFGDTALHLIMQEGYHGFIQAVQDNNAIALFQLFEHLPLSGIVSTLAVILIITFFVTSADSGALVLDSLASGGSPNTPVWQRVFWASLLGTVASVLLLAGGLKALQTASIVSALPFAIIMLIAMVGMWRALVLESHREMSLQSAVRHSGKAMELGSLNWKDRLAKLVEYPNKEDVSTFIKDVAHESMETVQTELKRRGWESEVYMDDDPVRTRIEVIKSEQMAFIYEVRLCEYIIPGFAFSELHVETETKTETKTETETQDENYYRAEVFLREGGESYDVYGYDRHNMISDILNHFEHYLHKLHHSAELLPWDIEQHEKQLQPNLNLNKEP
jgi:choline/glycine/proline betaine transport protein